MKAKDYAEKLWQGKCATAILAEIGKDFLVETVTLCEARHVKLGIGLANVVKELNQKWVKFAQIVNNDLYPTTKPVKLNGYLNLLKEYSPEAYSCYIEEQSLTGIGNFTYIGK